MKDNSRDITLAQGTQGCDRLTMTMGRNEMLATTKGKGVK